MGFWHRLHQFIGRRSGIKEVRLAPSLADSRIQFGDRVRVLPDKATDEKGFTGKIGTVYGQTTPSSTNPVIIGIPTKDYAVSVFFEELQDQFWFPEHVLELVDHGAGATITLDGVDKIWTRNAKGGWDEASSR